MARNLNALLKQKVAEGALDTDASSVVVPIPQSADADANSRRSRFSDMMSEGRAGIGVPVGAMSTALENIKGQSEAKIAALKSQIEAGDTVVEIETDKIDRSFVSDRMSGFDSDHQQLVEQIKAQGQLVPILVRPHPETADRFQVAYGHRRLKVAAELGIKVRAVVKPLTDDELVVAQGQENNSRLNLSFIEKAIFAATLEERKFKRTTIMASLSLKKSDLSNLISVATKMPRDVVDAIGRAPGIGRPRWLELLALILQPQGIDRAREVMAKAEFEEMESDARFNAILLKLSRKARALTSPDGALFWNGPDGRRLARVTDNGTKYTLQIDKSVDADFGPFLYSKLEGLYREFKSGQ